MAELLAPKLKPISVRYDQLVLDPNNPRFTTRKEDRIAEGHFLDQDLAGITESKLFTKGDRFKIEELVNSIKRNGWLPVDYIFVRKLKDDPKRYVVLEGNRRVAAIREIMKDTKGAAKPKNELASIQVMEIVDKISSEELQKKITYLLGVRHHGSLKRWTPFAQAYNIFVRYLEVSGQNSDTFTWSQSHGQVVADTLSIPLEEVRDRLKVYRVMSQIGNSPLVKESEGGMEDRYYSVCEEPLVKPRKMLGSYVEQDPKSFLLTEETVGRIIEVCHFNQANREGAPIRNPQEWRYLDRILADEDISKKQMNLREVEVHKRLPSEVWAERAAELSPVNWEKWLFQVNTILKSVSLGDDFKSEKATDSFNRLVALIEKLDQKDLH